LNGVSARQVASRPGTGRLERSTQSYNCVGHGPRCIGRVAPAAADCVSSVSYTAVSIFNDLRDMREITHDTDYCGLQCARAALHAALPRPRGVWGRGPRHIITHTGGYCRVCTAPQRRTSAGGVRIRLCAAGRWARTQLEGLRRPFEGRRRSSSTQRRRALRASVARALAPARSRRQRRCQSAAAAAGQPCGAPSAA
jgi:hypothetical protein